LPSEGKGHILESCRLYFFGISLGTPAGPAPGPQLSGDER
jgi:hypothetical protein